MKNPYKIKPGPLVERFTPDQQDIACRISNDIAEDVDNEDTIEALRMAVAYYADVAAVASEKAAKMQWQLDVIRNSIGLVEHGIGILRTALK